MTLIRRSCRQPRLPKHFATKKPFAPRIRRKQSGMIREIAPGEDHEAAGVYVNGVMQSSCTGKLILPWHCSGQGPVTEKQVFEAIEQFLRTKTQAFVADWQDLKAGRVLLAVLMKTVDTYKAGKPDDPVEDLLREDKSTDTLHLEVQVLQKLLREDFFAHFRQGDLFENAILKHALGTIGTLPPSFPGD